MILEETQRETVGITYQSLDEEGGTPSICHSESMALWVRWGSVSVSLTGYSGWSPGLIIM